jgi:hypothetical protein
MASNPDVVVALGGRVVPILMQLSRTIPIVVPGAGDHWGRLEPVLPHTDVFLPNDEPERSQVASGLAHFLSSRGQDRIDARLEGAQPHFPKHQLRRLRGLG